MQEDIWMDFLLEDTILWIMDLYYCLKRQFKFKMFKLWICFFTKTELFTLQDIIWWTGVVWIIVMFLSAVWTLSLTASIHCRGSIAEQML